MSESLYYNGRKVSELGFTPATTKGRQPIFIQTEGGRTAQLFFGVTEYGVPGVPEFIRGENHMRSHKVPAHCILWLPSAKVNPTKKCLGGLTIDWEEYLKVQANPSEYKEEVNKLAQYHIPLNICMED